MPAKELRLPARDGEDSVGVHDHRSLAPPRTEVCQEIDIVAPMPDDFTVVTEIEADEDERDPGEAADQTGDPVVVVDRRVSLHDVEIP